MAPGSARNWSEDCRQNMLSHFSASSFPRFSHTHTLAALAVPGIFTCVLRTQRWRLCASLLLTPGSAALLAKPQTEASPGPGAASSSDSLQNLPVSPALEPWAIEFVLCLVYACYPRSLHSLGTRQALAGHSPGTAGHSPGTHWALAGTHRALAGHLLGTHQALMGTHRALTRFSPGTHWALARQSQGTCGHSLGTCGHSALAGHSLGTHWALAPPH